MFLTNEEELVKHLEENNLSIADYTLGYECSLKNKKSKDVLMEMQKMLDVMRKSVVRAQSEEVISVSGISGGDAYRYRQYLNKNQSLIGDVGSNAVAMALSASEVNASMGLIVACPTAGSCGIVPSVLISSATKYNVGDDEIVKSLFTASGIGIIIANNATLSGAEGGCQAECGSAAAMAAGALVELLGGSVKQAFWAAAMALKNVMGLICDPVAGLVEIPCVKRNASGALNALLCAELAFAGICSKIPFGEVVETMNLVGKSMGTDHKETAKGGIAITKSALKMQKTVFSK